jgi:hypothetical protein
MEKMSRALASLTAIAGAALLAAACGDSATGPGSGGQVSLSLTTGAEGGTSPSVSASRVGPTLSVTQNDGQGNELVMDSVKVVLREIELKRQADDDCPDDGQSDDDACEEFEAGIRLFELPLDGNVEQVVTVDAPADTYDELEFEIHKPDDDDPEGQAFIDENPAFADVSIRVVGTFNGDPFTFTQDLNEEQEVVLDPPLVVEEGADPVNVTLELDVRTWFTRDGELVDPTTAAEGGANENLVENNIENSIEAFEDDDSDGEDDDGDDG